MAQMIPDALPPGRSAAEGLVFSRLQLLPDDCLVYYEPAVGDRYPDFVVILPDAGLLVIEVKGWRPYQIVAGTSHSIHFQERAGAPEEVRANPIRQARDYMHRLMDVCRRHPAGAGLLHEEGPHQGRFVFPFGFCAALSQISDAELRGHPLGDLRSILPVHHVLAADELAAWARLEGAEMKQRLAAFFDPRWPFPRLTEAQVRALRSIIHPEVLVPPTPTQLAEVAALGAQLLLATERACAAAPDLRTLDLVQERAARSLGSGHRLLFGVAGSGKTVVLVARARLLSQALPSGRILVLCFNVAFRSYLRAVLEPCANVEVLTFHGFGARNGVPFARQEPEEYGRELGEVLATGQGDAGRYDAVMIDEAQDFDPSWFRCATLALREPRDGDLMIVGDRNQTSYPRGRVSWSRLGISAQGRSRILRSNYRNTRAILEAAAPFADEEGDEDGIAGAACDPSRARRSTDLRPILVERSTRDAELEAAEGLVGDLLAGRLAGQRLRPLQPSEIGLLYRRADEPVLASLEELVGRLGRLAPVVWLNRKAPRRDPRQEVLQPGIKLQTIHSAKGLQYRAVVLLFADQLGAAEADQEGDRRLLYVALTRPEDALAVTFLAREAGTASALVETMRASPAFLHA
jgi:hypothetical protein